MKKRLLTIAYNDVIEPDRDVPRLLVLLLLFSIPAIFGLFVSWHCFDNNPPLWFHNTFGPYICFHVHTFALVLSFVIAIFTSKFIELKNRSVVIVAVALALEYVFAGGLAYLLMFASAMSF